MRELAAFAFVFFGFSLWHFAMPARRPNTFKNLKIPRAGLFLAGTISLALAVAVAWPEGATYAWLFMLTAASVSATGFVLFAPVLPRVTWLLAAASGPIAALLWLGASRG